MVFSCGLTPCPDWGADATHLNLSCHSLHAHGSITLARCWFFGIFLVTKKSKKRMITEIYLDKLCSLESNSSLSKDKMTKMNWCHLRGYQPPAMILPWHRKVVIKLIHIHRGVMRCWWPCLPLHRHVLCCSANTHSFMRRNGLIPYHQVW